ncbi:MAG: polysaccharide pyruvyl transferase family protein [Thermoleophilaceae bacterium]|nr:polysaccharide pyruvyl transferase family protein [Thermoleophilaceae bacterium]
MEESRARLLDAIGPAPDLTFIRGIGNIGDEFIWAGTRELLAGHVYREIGLDELPLAGGELAVLTGGGAWSRPYNEYMPEALAIAELRFDRVIVLPSSFETVEDRVREALERTNALVFARELESLRQISGLCRADIAHDCAFFADVSAHETPGIGELNAFRTDHESAGPLTEAVAGEDISATAESLEGWLHTIARYAAVNTDRAHVMIAAARLGKQVRYREGNYFKLRAIAESSLVGYDVAPLEQARETLPPRTSTPMPDSRVTITLTGRDDPAGARESLISLAGADAGLIVLDRNSEDLTRAALLEFGAGDAQVSLRLADRDLGASGSALQATELAAGEYLLMLEYGMTLEPGALEQLVAALDDNPDAIAATAGPGGWIGDSGATLELTKGRADATARTGWVPVFGTLFRVTAFDDVPLAGAFGEPFQSIEFARLAEQAGRTLLACPGAVIGAAAERQTVSGSRFVANVRSAQAIANHAEFFHRNSRLIPDGLAELLPELLDSDGQFDERAARLLLELTLAKGPEWLIAERMNGGLEPLLGDGSEGKALTTVPADHLEWLERRNASLAGIESGGWWQLRGRVEPLIGAVSSARSAIRNRGAKR